MRNTSRGAVLPPLPFTPGLPGLDVSEPATPLEQLQAQHEFQAAVVSVPSRFVQADLGAIEARVAAWRAANPDIVSFWKDQSQSPTGRQSGHALGGVLGAIAGSIVFFVMVATWNTRVDDHRKLDGHACEAQGKDTAMRDGWVVCVERKKAVMS